MTDLISSVTNPIGFICSPRFKNLIEKFRIGATNFYDAKVRHEGQGYSDFHLMHCVNSYTEFINFSKSEVWFAKLENGIEVQEQVDVRTAEQYRSFEINLALGKMAPFCRSISKIIRFKPGFIPQHYLFVLNAIDGMTYVSPELRTALEASKFTGFIFDWNVKHIRFELSA